jgi:hypothetical protein
MSTSKKERSFRSRIVLNGLLLRGRNVKDASFVELLASNCIRDGFQRRFQVPVHASQSLVKAPHDMGMLACPMSLLNCAVMDKSLVNID